MHYRTIIISDLHLGTKNTRHQQVLDFLESNTCDHLILNGDIIDGRHLKFFDGWPKAHNAIITHLNKLMHNSSTKVSYLIGNHDEFRRNIVSKMMPNITIVDEHFYKSGDKTFLICHGHQFDKLEGHLYGLANLSFLIGTAIYRANRQYNALRKKLGLPYQSIVKQIKRIAKVFMVGGKDKFSEKVIKLCKEKNVDGLICGHLHKPEITPIGDYLYLNSGDRVESCSALVETHDNERKLVFQK